MTALPRFFSLLGSLIVLSVASITAEDSPGPTPGTITELPFSLLSQSLLLWLPKSHGEDPDRRWPVCLYYHGTNGSPTLNLALEVAGRENWILIGMTYREAGRFQGTPENLEAEKQIYQSLLEQWNADYSLQLDPNRVFVGGFSKGGWISGLFLENDPRLAGAIILGAGLLHETGEPESERSVSGKSVYLGLGEKDGNVAMSFGGADLLRTWGANVTWDLWEGIGHSISRPAPVYLQQWFAVEGAEKESLSVQSDAVEWLEKEWERIRELKTPLDQWAALENLNQSPWREFVDSELDSELALLRAELATQQDLVDEREARIQFFEILKAESENRRVETLRIAHQAYGVLASERSETLWGKRAAIARDRAAVLLP